jgi:OmpA-OmpF porin, OOP family
MKTLKGVFLTFLLFMQVMHALSQQDSQSVQSYSKYDFIPGEKVIFFDDFSSENIGDFPVQWNTTGSGEIVTTSLYPGRWLKITNSRGITTLADTLVLPDNYTIEFDVVPQKDASNNGNSVYCFYIISTSKPKDLNYGLARPGKNGIKFEFAYNNYYLAYYYDGTPPLSGSTTNPEYRQLADKKYRISIWVQKERIRVYENEAKVFDLAKAMSKNVKYNMIRFSGGTPMVSNFRIATGLPDMRNKLLTEGKLVSYGIYFDVNKDVVKPESNGTLKAIADVLNENPDLRVKIVGYTDSDGADAANLDLSKRRGAAVKNELVNNFKIAASRLESDGMGENQPVAPNDTPANKAKNRRVEFIKL